MLPLSLKRFSSVIALTGCAVVIFAIKWVKSPSKLIQKEIDCAEVEILEKEDEEPEAFEEILPGLIHANWVKIGKVPSLYVYPLTSGKKVASSVLNFSLHGIKSKAETFSIPDRKFYIYDQETQQFHNAFTKKGIVLTTVTYLDKSTVRFNKGLSEITLDLDKIMRDSKSLTLIDTNWIKLKFIDCGDQMAKWVNLHYGSTDDSTCLRLLLKECTIEKYIDDYKQMEDVFDEDEDNKTIENIGSIVPIKRALREHVDELMRCIVVTEQTMEEFATYPPNKTLRIQPHIIISAPSSDAYAETEWEWLRIGSTVFKRVMPVAELKCVQEAYKQPERFQPPKYVGTFYRIHIAGSVKRDDAVYLHVPNKSSSDDEQRSKVRSILKYYIFRFLNYTLSDFILF